MTKVIPNILFLDRKNYDRMPASKHWMDGLDFLIIIDRDPVTQKIFAFEVIKDRWNGVQDKVSVPLMKTLMKDWKEHYGIDLLDV